MLPACARAERPERRFVENFFQFCNLRLFLRGTFLDAAPRRRHALVHFRIFQIQQARDVKRGELIARELARRYSIEQRERETGSAGERFERGGAVGSGEIREPFQERGRNFRVIEAREKIDRRSTERIVVQQLHEHGHRGAVLRPIQNRERMLPRGLVRLCVGQRVAQTREGRRIAERRRELFGQPLHLRL